MTKEETIKAFNQYCAEVMGYEFKAAVESGKYLWRTLEGWSYCDPYSNLNQLAEVFDKLYAHAEKWQVERFENTLFAQHGIATAMREFIWSTKE